MLGVLSRGDGSAHIYNIYTVTVELYYIPIRPSQPIICAGDVMYCSCVCCLFIVHITEKTYTYMMTHITIASYRHAV